MTAPRIFVTRQIPQTGIELLLSRGYRVEVHHGSKALSKTQLAEKMRHAQALISLLSDQIDKELINSAPQLKIIANFAVGFNNIDIDYAKEKNIIVTNTPDVLTAATADLTWALILALSKRIVEGDRFMRQGLFKGWEPELLLGGDVSGKTLGVICAGSIGRAVAQRATGFDMKILYTANSAKPAFERRTNARFVQLGELLEKADYISLHCPLSAQTKHLLNKDRLRQIKKGAYLINTSRGAVVDERALVEALRNGHLAGAGLDVYEFEPQVSKELLSIQNVVLLPHVGSATVETRSEMARICARNIIAVLEGKEALNPVN